MKMKRFHKLLVSIGLSAALTFGMTSAAFADTTTATLQPVETSGNTDSRVTSGDTPAASAAYYPSYSNSGIRQTDALYQNNSYKIKVQWDAVSRAKKYAVSISHYGKNSFKLMGYTPRRFVTIKNLLPGTVYTLKVTAINSSGKAISTRTVDCTTLYKTVSVRSSWSSNAATGYTFNMTVPKAANSISGYKVVYESSANHKKVTKLFNTRYSFTLPLARNSFYKVSIYPYIQLNNKRCVSPTPTNYIVSKEIILAKAGNTRNTMTVRWNKVSGADSYSIYIKAPGSSFKKVKTTGKTTYTLTNMSLNKQYQIRVVANKKLYGKQWRSAFKTYNMSLS